MSFEVNSSFGTCFLLRWRLSTILYISLYINLGILDLVLNFPGYHRWRFNDVLRNILKVVMSLAWVIILPLFYVHSFKGAPEGIKEMLSSLHQVKGIPPLYILAVAVYLIPNVLGAVLFLFPMLRRWIENSDWVLVRLLLWWSQVYFYVPYALFISFNCTLNNFCWWLLVVLFYW